MPLPWCPWCRWLASRCSGVLDGRTIVERQRSDAEEEFLQRSLRFNLEVDRLKKDAGGVLAALERERQSSAAGLRSLRSAHARSVAQLHALVTSGQGAMRQQEERFLVAHASSCRELRALVDGIKADYDAEVERIAMAETERMNACRKRLLLLDARSLALAATRQAVAAAEMGGDGRLYAEPVERSDPQFAYVRARAEAEAMNASGIPAADAPSIHMLACYRLYRVPATAAAATAAAAAAAATASVGGAKPAGGGGYPLHSSFFRGSWWWQCAPLPALLDAAAKFVPRGDGSALVDSAKTHADGASGPTSNWGAKLHPALPVKDSVPINTSLVAKPSAPVVQASGSGARSPAKAAARPAERRVHGEYEGLGEEDFDDDDVAYGNGSHGGFSGDPDEADPHPGDAPPVVANAEASSPTTICAALLCRSTYEMSGGHMPSGAGAYGGPLAGSGMPVGPSATELTASARAAAPEYLVIYEIAPHDVEVRSLLAHAHDLSSFIVPPPSWQSLAGPAPAAAAGGGGKRKKDKAAAALLASLDDGSDPPLPTHYQPTQPNVPLMAQVRAPRPSIPRHPLFAPCVTPHLTVALTMPLAPCVRSQPSTTSISSKSLWADSSSPRARHLRHLR